MHIGDLKLVRLEEMLSWMVRIIITKGSLSIFVFLTVKTKAKQLILIATPTENAALFSHCEALLLACKDLTYLLLLQVVFFAKDLSWFDDEFELLRVFFIKINHLLLFLLTHFSFLVPSKSKLAIHIPTPRVHVSLDI